jgi:acyl-CoA carboxylase epsilon subunit-like protein
MLDVMSIAEAEVPAGQILNTADGAALGTTLSTTSSAAAADDGSSAEAAILRVLRGNPNPVEVAALVVALAHIRARDAAAIELAERGTATHRLPVSAPWGRPHQVAYQSPSSWMRAA